ncbi:MAG TPA: hypothetical protein GX704_04050 [Clostridiales bacterium]|nr:hypothetical protein [Clostridiales bacterium]
MERNRKKPYFRLSDYIIIAMMASIGIAVKTIIVPLAQIITGPLFIPGGVLAGGFYMMFLVLGEAITNKRGAALLVSLVQAVLVTITGTLGSHGAASLLTYTISGLAVELWFVLSRHRGCCAFCCFIGGMVANMAESFAVNLAIFNLPLIPMLLSLCVAALSGGFGGLVASAVACNIRRMGILGVKSPEKKLRSASETSGGGSEKKSAHKSFIGFFLILCCVLFLSGCSVTGGEAGASGQTPYTGAVHTLTVTGDVAGAVTLTGYDGWETSEVQYEEDRRTVIPLLPVLNSAGITGEEVIVFFSSGDGFIIGIPLEQISENCSLYLSGEYGWQLLSEEHPVQSRVKFMDKIVAAASRPGAEGRCVRIIDGTDEITLTYGDLFKAESVLRVVPEGEAKKNQYTTTVYTRRALIPISEYLERSAGEGETTALAYYGDGSQGEISLSGFFEWRGNSADYIAPDGRSRKKDIIGVWADAPGISVTDVFPEALSALEKGRVLIIELDGMGYYDLMELEPAFLYGKNPLPARTVMPSVSSVALAAILTGKLPSENGIPAEKMREPIVPDMFEIAAKTGSTSAMVEGSSKLINTSIEQILNPDANGNGSTDDEVFECAKEQIADGAELIYVHFHGYDDISHTYGPLSAEASSKMAELDDYVRRLCTDFSGSVIVTADHGQHPFKGDKLGEHGEFRLLDMTVPWIRFES